MSASKELFETDVLCETLPMEVQVVVHHQPQAVAGVHDYAVDPLCMVCQWWSSAWESY